MNTGASATLSPLARAISQRIRASLDLLDRTPHSLIALAARFGTAGVFWRSGETKVDGWQVTEFAIQLFRDEYKVPLLPPELAATLAATAEHLFPALLVIGLASRLSALALLGMTAVIQFFVYPQSWPDHLVWATSFLFVFAYGPGRISLDYLIRRTCERSGIF